MKTSFPGTSFVDSLPMAEILLTTLNATYCHCAFGLRYLYANLGPLRDRAEIMEFTIDQDPSDLVEKILAKRPKIVGLGVYIWNTQLSLQVVGILRRVAPEVIVVLGGPEVSFESESQEIVKEAHFTFKGEADSLFAQFCEDYLLRSQLPANKIISGPLPDVKTISLPYSYYTDEDIKRRVIYVEASRGCPFKCEFCLSALDVSVRNFDITKFLNAIDQLIARGARQFKFVDRTFNLNIAFSRQILSFFLERMHHNLFLHFEMIPDRLPQELRSLIQQFPAGSLQFEIGVQTWSDEVSQRISRHQNIAKLEDNFRFLIQETKVHVHADLIVGLPGEDIESFAAGFDKLIALSPHEIQVGILKRLKGTPIVRHDEQWDMHYQPAPPFSILRTKVMDFSTLQSLKRFAKFWDLVANSGNFKRTRKIVEQLGHDSEQGSLFWEFYRLSEFLSQRHPKRHSIALANLAESLWCYLTEVRGVAAPVARQAIEGDYCHDTKRDLPPFLKSGVLLPRKSIASARFSARQQKHNEAMVSSPPSH